MALRVGGRQCRGRSGLMEPQPSLAAAKAGGLRPGLTRVRSCAVGGERLSPWVLRRWAADGVKRGVSTEAGRGRRCSL